MIFLRMSALIAFLFLSSAVFSGISEQEWGGRYFSPEEMHNERCAAIGGKKCSEESLLGLKKAHRSFCQMAMKSVLKSKSKSPQFQAAIPDMYPPHLIQGCKKGGYLSGTLTLEKEKNTDSDGSLNANDEFIRAEESCDGPVRFGSCTSGNDVRNDIEEIRDGSIGYYEQEDVDFFGEEVEGVVSGLSKEKSETIEELLDDGYGDNWGSGVGNDVVIDENDYSADDFGFNE